MQAVKGVCMSFKEWRRLVDREVASHCGLTAGCLPDIDFWNYYYDGITEEEAVEAAKECAYDLLSEEGFPFD